MAQDTNIRGFACDHSSLEISIDGSPTPYGFTTVDPKIDSNYEKLFIHGQANPIARTEGTIDASMDAEMPMAQYMMLTEELGGQGDNPMVPQFLFREFSVLLSFRPKNQDRTYQIEYKRCTIKSPAVSSGQGKAAMAKFTVDALGVEHKPVS